MQQVLTLRKIILIFGFVLLFIGCADNKAISRNDIIGLTAENVPEGVRLTLDHIPPKIKQIDFAFEAEGGNIHGLVTSILGTSLEQFKETRALICPFLQNGLNYTVRAYFFEEDEGDPLYSASTEIVADNGTLFVPNGITLELNETKTGATLSAFPEISGNAQHVYEAKYSYLVAVMAENDSVIFRYEKNYNNLTFDFSSMFDEIKNENVSVGDYRAFVFTTGEFEYGNSSWRLIFTNSEEFVFSL